jgi:hypothetical protein
MRQNTLFLAALIGAPLLVAPPARAQGPVVFYLGQQGDTAAGAVPGAEADIAVRAINPWFSYAYYYNSVASAKVTFVFDTTKVQLLGVQSLGTGLYTINSAVSGPGTLTVNASGYAYGSDAELYALRVKLISGVTDGSYIWIKSDSAALCYYNCGSYGTYYKPAVSAIGQVCHATEVWGDVDGNFQVDSRDALITLSAAVGLPVNGFDLPQGDVDGDGLTNSRDALIMLSYAIALPVSSVRVGAGIPDACPGLTAPGDSVVFQRSDYPGLAYLGGTSLTPAAIPGATNTFGPGVPQLAHDGRSVVYACLTGQICRVDADTGGVVQLTSDVLPDFRPTWSPGGDSIAYIQSGTIRKMKADGSGQVSVGGTGAIVVKWSPDGTKLAYTNGSLHVVNTDGTNDVTVATGVSGSVVTVLWYPAGDSLAFEMGGDPRLWAVPVGGGSATVLEGFAGAVDPGSDLGPAGRIFSLDRQDGSPPSIWVVRGRSGPVFRVTRPAVADHTPAWRRNP